MSGLTPVVKLVVHIASTVGVSKVVGDVIRNNTTIQTTADVVKVWTGSVVIGAMVAEAATKTVDRQWDNVSKLTKSLTNKTDATKPETES